MAQKLLEIEKIHEQLYKELTYDEIIRISKIIFNKYIEKKENKDPLKKYILSKINQVEKDFLNLYPYNNINKDINKERLYIATQIYVRKLFRKIVHPGFTTFTYYGEILICENKSMLECFENGFGILEYSHNDFYIGNWTKGTRNGIGEMVFDAGNGDKYIWTGQWINGVRDENKEKSEGGYWFNKEKGLISGIL